MRRTPLKRGTKGLSATKGLSQKSGGLTSKSKLKIKKKINGKSTKQRKREDSYNANVQFEEGTTCTGCGYGGSLSRSHLVPRSFNRNLTDNKQNVRPHCLDRGTVIGCHTKWESHSMRRELLDYEENMAIVKELDEQYYWILMEKEKEHYE